MRLYISIDGSLQITLARERRIAPDMAGQLDTLSYPDHGLSQTWCVELADSSGNRSCRRCTDVNIPPVAVDPPRPRPSSPPATTWYDVSGRRIQALERAPRGWYLEILGDSARVVLALERGFLYGRRVSTSSLRR